MTLSFVAEDEVHGHEEEDHIEVCCFPFFSPFGVYLRVTFPVSIM